MVGAGVAGRLGLAVAVALVASACQAPGSMGRAATTPRPMLKSRPISVATAADQRIVHGHTVAIVPISGGHQIVVDGRVLATDTQDDRVMVKGVYEGGGRAYVLIEEQSGGIACPSLYQAVDLNGSAPSISPQIGNCSDLPQVSVSGGALRLSVPRFRAAPAKIFSIK